MIGRISEFVPTAPQNPRKMMYNEDYCFFLKPVLITHLTDRQ